LIIDKTRVFLAKRIILMKSKKVEGESKYPIDNIKHNCRKEGCKEYH
jgi:hypothetical protein